MTQMELDQQLGGIYSLLTVEFLVPYLNRKLSIAQKNGTIPRLPDKLVKPTIVAGVNALGRGTRQRSFGHVYDNHCTNNGTRSYHENILIKMNTSND